MASTCPLQRMAAVPFNLLLAHGAAWLGTACKAGLTLQGRVAAVQT